MLRPICDESKLMPIDEFNREVLGERPDWERGDALIGVGNCGKVFRLEFLAWSELDRGCFIAQDDDGDISDDWMWKDFRLEHGGDE